MERFTRRLIWGIATLILIVGIAVAIWEAIPGIIKFVAVVCIIGGFLGMFKK